MPFSTPLSSMFHRRLALVMGGVVVVMAGLAAQLSRLTVARGEELREEAESKLVMRDWIGTSRGRILDRKGRVLAQDRPSFDVEVDYSLIGSVMPAADAKSSQSQPQSPPEWVTHRAGSAARRAYRDRWKSLDTAGRQALLDPYIAAYQAHVDRMWRVLAETAHVSDDDLIKCRNEIIHRVSIMKWSHYSRRVGDEMEARLARGEELSADLNESDQSRLEQSIGEEQSPHVILSRVPDEVGFALMRMVDQKVQIAIPGPDGDTTDTVPLLPGVKVVPSGDREYPYDTVSVDVDLSTLPSPVRATGTRAITVEGVAYQVLGRMKDTAQKEDQDRRSLRLYGRKKPGTDEYDPKPDQAFAARVLTPRGTPGLKEQWDRGAYQDDDSCGSGGVEESREDELRGLRGLTIEQRETGQVTTISPERGRDVQLTLDIALQARVQAAMSKDLGLAVAQQWQYADGKSNPTVPIGTPLDGAAVVLDVDTGDILAMVSTPSLSREQAREHPDEVFADPENRQVDLPWLNRAIDRPYPPGSIAKALMLNASVMLGKHDLDSPIECTGHLFPDKPNMFRCWIYKEYGGQTHTMQLGHALSAPEALMVSCNIYFFTVGERLGPRGIVQAYQMFGLGQPWNLGAGDEFMGYLGFDPEGRKKGHDYPASAAKPGVIELQDSIQMGIGQGPVAWTPLHAAAAYATIARGGVQVPPRLISEPHAEPTQDIGLDPRAVTAALEGLSLSINDNRGTGNHLSINGRHEKHFNVPGVEVWGKTGTATAPTIYALETMPDPSKVAPGAQVHNPLWDTAVEGSAIAEADPGSNFHAPPGRRVLRWGDHSWFVVLVGKEGEHRPRYAIAVVMEYAGSGGKVSGPIVNQIIWALRAEGYL